MIIIDGAAHLVLVLYFGIGFCNSTTALILYDAVIQEADQSLTDAAHTS